jgi:hypothetical protein
VSNDARNGVIHFARESTPSAQKRTVPTLHGAPHAPVGIPASPWMLAKVRSKRGALIRLCGDGVVSNDARNGVIHFARESTPSAQKRTVPTLHGAPHAPVGIPASPWMLAKVRSKRGALIRLCGDGVVSNDARNGVIHFARESTPSAQKRTVPTIHGAPHAPVGVCAEPLIGWGGATDSSVADEAEDTARSLSRSEPASWDKALLTLPHCSFESFASIRRCRSGSRRPE